MNPGKPQADRAAGTGRTADTDTATSGNLLAELRGGDAAAEAQPLLKPKRRIKIQNVMVGAVIVFSIGALYAMRLHGMGSGVSFETVPIDYKLDGSTGRLTPEQRRILADLRVSDEPIRVAAAQIDKNPFRLDNEARVLTPGNDPVPPPPRGDPEAMLQVEIATALGRLELNGIMLGRIPIARINGKIYKEGDTIDGLFILKAVTDRTVELEAGGRTYALSIGQPDNRNP